MDANQAQRPEFSARPMEVQVAGSNTWAVEVSGDGDDALATFTLLDGPGYLA